MKLTVRQKVVEEILGLIAKRGGMGNRVDAYDVLDKIYPTWRKKWR